MSSKQRLALILAALVVAVVAFVVLNPSDDARNGDDKQAAATTPAESAPDQAPDDTPTDAQRSETAAAPPAPPVERIAIVGGQVEGGVRTITVAKGDRVRIVITSDAPDELHLHGYDIERAAAPGKPARFALTADLEGVFELESHTAEHQGLPPAVAKLVVEPS